MSTNGKWISLTVVALLVPWTAPQSAAQASPPSVTEQSSVDAELRRGRLRTVRCPQQRLATVLSNANPGDRIRIVGTCAERVTIAIDDLLLTGGPQGALDGGGGGPAEFAAVITVDGARRVTLEGLTVRNGPGEGILVRGGGAVTLQNVIAENNGFTGVAVGDNSVVTLRDVVLRGNAVGLDVITGSAAVVQGLVSASGNGSGVDVNGQSIVEIRGGELAAVDNFGPGIVASSSQIAIFGFTESQVPGSRITVTGNGAFGIGLPNSSLEILGGSFEAAAPTWSR